MKDLNPNYLADGDMVIYNDRDTAVKINTMSIFARKEFYTPSCCSNLAERFELPEMKYKHGEFTCAVVPMSYWYRMTVISETFGDEEPDIQMYLVLEKDINAEIDQLEEYWSRELLSDYHIHQMTREGDYKLITNDEIYARQDRDEVTGMSKGRSDA